MAPVTGGTYAFEYDALNRLSSRYNWHYRTRYTYADGANEGETTTQVSQISFETRTGGPSFTPFSIQYAYDALGNISAVNSTGRSDLDATYTYDAQGQLTKEIRGGDTYEYIYDTYGNIRSVEKNDAVIHTYTYGDTNWLDKLTAYDGHSITYDAIGNPDNWYNTKAWTALTWQNGRQLASITDGTTTISFTYDVAGIRDSKTVGSTTYNYLTQNGQVVRQTWGSNVMDFIYDNQSRPYALVYNGTTYYYLLNLQGDVIGIITQAGVSVATYTYDAWGAIVSKSGSMADVNPIRYRGYYYDKETGLYYLQSRYYDPTVKRFVNADGYASTGQGFIGYNMFAYCNNNPINYEDPSGNIDEWVLKYYGTEYYYQYLRDTYYGSAEEAAGAFAEEAYGLGSFLQSELCSRIYSFDAGGTLLYNYTTPTIGSQHKSLWGENIPSGTRYVGFVHTHPTYNYFSETDINIANNNNIDAYFVGPNKLIGKYDVTTGITSSSIRPISFVPVGAIVGKALVGAYYVAWDAHTKECSRCAKKEWPG